jgi:Ca2+-binding EF-hand superfamily protein
MRSGSTNGLALVSLTDVLVEHFRSAILGRVGPGGMHELGRRFRIMDEDGNRQVNLDELTYGLNQIGLHIEPKDLQLLLAAVDRDNTGSLSFSEFLLSVHGPMSPKRQQLILMAFDLIDRNHNGMVQVDDIRMIYDVKHHPDVLAGRMEEGQALQHFLSQFDGVQKDGCVNQREFFEYYRSVSASVPDDEYFELIIRNAWHISGGQGQSQNTSNARVLATFADGTQKVVTIKDDLGLDLRNQSAVIASLERQGLNNIIAVEKS